MGESRQELLGWLNALLQLNFTKVEECGTGAALCQIMDSIYGDVPMNKVKFEVNAEYQYIANFKVLQTSFLQHKIDRSIPVERLTKCRFQDNLEFLQWAKRFWDANYPGGEYDPVARRRGTGNTTLRTTSAARPASVVASRKPLGRVASNSTPVPVAKPRTPSNAQVVQLQAELAATVEHAEGLERERDFYFSKLREIEILLQAAADESAEQARSGVEPDSEKQLLIKQMEEILYTTEDGFEPPEGNLPAEDVEETF
ncbi:calponin homology domain-containing protein [Dipodascopsis tothii]|uniref:calponin homology domain-containing protein n=1 Tax=Dipodascopsis tothii TaxID=44089 RepID=UPI0034CF64F5